MKLKYNENKDSYTIKGLQYEHLVTLQAILQHVRLGSDGCYPKEVAYDFLTEIGAEIGDDAHEEEIDLGFTIEAHGQELDVTIELNLV